MENEMIHFSPGLDGGQAQPNVLFAVLANWAGSYRPRLFKRDIHSLGEVEFIWSGIERLPVSYLKSGNQLLRSSLWLDEGAMFACEIGDGLAKELVSEIIETQFPVTRFNLSRLEWGIVENQLGGLLRELGLNINPMRMRTSNLNISLPFKIIIKVKIRNRIGAMSLYFSESSLIEFIGAPSLAEWFLHNRIPVKVELAGTKLSWDDVRRLEIGDAIVFEGIPSVQEGAGLAACLSFNGFNFPVHITEDGKFSLSGEINSQDHPRTNFEHGSRVETDTQPNDVNEQVRVALMLDATSLSPVDFIELLKGNSVRYCTGSRVLKAMIQLPGTSATPAEIQSFNGCLMAVLKSSGKLKP